MLIPNPVLVVAAACTLFLLGAALGIAEQHTRSALVAGNQGAPSRLSKASLACAVAACAIAFSATLLLLSGYGINGFSSENHTLHIVTLPFSVHLGGGFPQLLFGLSIDRLGAFWVAMISVVGACAGTFSLSWLRGNSRQGEIAGGLNLILLCMLVTVLADGCFSFVVCYELLTLLVAYFVLSPIREASVDTPTSSTVKQALRSYIVYNHVGIVLVAACFLIIEAGSGSNKASLQFIDLNGTSLEGWTATLAFGLGFLGFGIKAGLFPFHSWVPRAHPQLPVNMHALMSGVMLKIAVYGMIRTFFEFLSPQIGWGIVVVLAAGITALHSVTAAILSKDLKRALAYHSIENIGIIVAALGIAMIFVSQLESTQNLDYVLAAAIVALAAAVFHVLNHSLFKTLLFFCMGTIERARGTVEIDRLGGLMRSMPWTSIAFIAGAVAISGFPPFNGFASEWLLLKSFMSLSELDLGLLSRFSLYLLIAVGLAMLGAAFALTALAFLKITGITILGQPRQSSSRAVDAAWDAQGPTRSVFAFLAAACLSLGLASSYAGSTIGAVAESVVSRGTVQRASESDMLDKMLQSPLSLWWLLFATFVTLIALWLTRRIRTDANVKPPATWSGGEQFDPTSMQHSGSTASAYVWEVFASPASTDEVLDGNRFVIAPGLEVEDRAEVLIDRVIRWITRTSSSFSLTLQNGDIRRYLLYIASAAAVSLVYTVVKIWIAGS